MYYHTYEQVIFESVCFGTIILKAPSRSAQVKHILLVVLSFVRARALRIWQRKKKHSFRIMVRDLQSTSPISHIPNHAEVVEDTVVVA